VRFVDEDGSDLLEERATEGADLSAQLRQGKAHVANGRSEPDIEAAVAHLRELPCSATASMPVEWSRKRFLDTLAATLRANPKAKGALPVAPGVWELAQTFRY
jgi:hypothetical protein